MKNKSIIISETTHKKIKDFCKENSFKINDWVDKFLYQKLEEIQNESTKKNILHSDRNVEL